MGPQELLLLGAIGFLLFGAKKLPELAKSFGTSIIEFKKAIKEADEPQDGTLPVRAQAPTEPVKRA